VTNVEIRGEESEEVDQLKGDVRMATLCRARFVLASVRCAPT